MINYTTAWKRKVNFKPIDLSNYEHFFKNKTFYLSEKIDGMIGALVYIRNEDCYIQTPIGNEIRNISLTYNYQHILDSIPEIKSIVIIGELAAVINNKILSFSKSMSIIKTYSRGNNGSLIYHFLYDIYQMNGKEVSFIDSIKLLKELFSYNKKSKNIIPLKQTLGSLKEFNILWDNLNSTQGFEGVVLRTNEGRAYKIKKILTFDLVVIGMGNPEYKTYGRKEISYLLTAFLVGDNLFFLSSKIGGGFTDKERKDLFKYCIDKETNKLKNGDILVIPKLIIEVEVNGIMKKEMKKYKYDRDRGYEEVGKEIGYSLRNPRFIRIREDKSINEFDTGLRQIPKELN